MSYINKLSNSDDEEDLDALRLAALQTLKRKDAANSSSHSLGLVNSDNHSRYSRHNKRGKFFGNVQNRGSKNGQFTNRVHNPNLIPIPTVPSDEDILKNKQAEPELTLNLPQNRYCDVKNKDDKSEVKSKFNRYDNSDKSEESESEEEADLSDDNLSLGKLERSNSLEALMQELDDEIHGKTKEKKEDKAEKKIKRVRKKKLTISIEAEANVDIKMAEEPKVEIIKHKNEENPTTDSLIAKPESPPQNRPIGKDEKHKSMDISPPFKRARSRSPMRDRFNGHRRGNFRKFQSRSTNQSYCPPPLTQFPPPIIQFCPFNPPPFAPPNILSQPPPFFERPLPPLNINTDSLANVAMAPLSPRSAAFVLKNNAIIEKRKRSPRRSYSRSLSRSPRRSLSPRRSPRRSLSPIRRISRSPKRLSRSPRRRSLSPRRRSLSPRRRSLSPKRKPSPKSRPSLRERLGTKPAGKADDEKDKVKEKIETISKNEEKSLDPILEARKRKFESNELKKKQGIIRLRPKTEENESRENVRQSPKKTQANDSDPIAELENLLKSEEEILLQGEDEELIQLPRVDDLFSDEDSASDNEGRFKVAEKKGEKPPVLSFTKLVNGVKGEIKAEPLPDGLIRRSRPVRKARDSDDKRCQRRSPRGRVERKDSSRDLGKSPVKRESRDLKQVVRNRGSTRSERRSTPTLDKRFERKIEIKIKNPAKYERNKVKLPEAEEKLPKKVERKVEVDVKEEIKEKLVEKEVEKEIVVKNNSGDEENNLKKEGDLRAQLSKKRAEKLCRIPISDSVSSRLLQNALQGAVFKKARKKSKEPSITSSDGKLPIHLRLGIANGNDKPTKRKSRKRKNREMLEQV